MPGTLQSFSVCVMWSFLLLWRFAYGSAINLSVSLMIRFGRAAMMASCDDDRVPARCLLAFCMIDSLYKRV